MGGWGGGLILYVMLVPNAPIPSLISLIVSVDVKHHVYSLHHVYSRPGIKGDGGKTTTTRTIDIKVLGSQPVRNNLQSALSTVVGIKSQKRPS